MSCTSLKYYSILKLRYSVLHNPKSCTSLKYYSILKPTATLPSAGTVVHLSNITVS